MRRNEAASSRQTSSGSGRGRRSGDGGGRGAELRRRDGSHAQELLRTETHSILLSVCALSSASSSLCRVRRAAHKSACQINRSPPDTEPGADAGGTPHTTQRRTYGQTHLNRGIGVSPSCVCCLCRPALRLLLPLRPWQDFRSGADCAQRKQTDTHSRGRTHVALKQTSCLSSHLFWHPHSFFPVMTSEHKRFVPLCRRSALRDLTQTAPTARGGHQIATGTASAHVLSLCLSVR
jgi:hypothetical protein